MLQATFRGTQRCLYRIVAHYIANEHKLFTSFQSTDVHSQSMFCSPGSLTTQKQRSSTFQTDVEGRRGRKEAWIKQKGGGIQVSANKSPILTSRSLLLLEADHFKQLLCKKSFLMNFTPDNNRPCHLSGYARLSSFVLQLQDVFGQMPLAPDSLSAWCCYGCDLYEC